MNPILTAIFLISIIVSIIALIVDSQNFFHKIDIKVIIIVCFIYVMYISAWILCPKVTTGTDMNIYTLSYDDNAVIFPELKTLTKWDTYSIKTNPNINIISKILIYFGAKDPSYYIVKTTINTKSIDINDPSTVTLVKNGNIYYVILHNDPSIKYIIYPYEVKTNNTYMKLLYDQTSKINVQENGKNAIEYLRSKLVTNK